MFWFLMGIEILNTYFGPYPEFLASSSSDYASVSLRIVSTICYMLPAFFLFILLAFYSNLSCVIIFFTN